MFRWLSLILYFAVPALTMGLIAEEKRTGTIELLITMPVKDGPRSSSGSSSAFSGSTPCCSR